MSGVIVVDTNLLVLLVAGSASIGNYGDTCFIFQLPEGEMPPDLRQGRARGLRICGPTQAIGK